MYYQKRHPWFVWPFLALIIFVIIFHVIIYMKNGVWRWLSFLPSTSILSFLAYCCRFYFVFADYDQLRFGYAIGGVRLNLADISQIEETNIKWIKWRGQGWRLKSLKYIRLYHR